MIALVVALGCLAAVVVPWVCTLYIDHARQRWVDRTLRQAKLPTENERKVDRALALIWRCPNCRELTAGRFRCVNCRAWKS